MANRPASVLPGLCILLFIIFWSVGVCAQVKERPKLKDFGSSLNKNKDAKKKTVVETRAKSNSQSGKDDVDVVKVETSLVSNDVLVLDAKGNPVPGLTDKDFLIREDGQPQTVGMLTLGDDAKVTRTIVLIIDYSSSQSPFIQTSIAAAKALVDKLPASDSMAIVTDDVEVIQDFTRDKQKLKSKLDSLLDRVSPFLKGPMPHFGKSKQYSALLATLNEAFNDEDQRPIVIFQTDGDQLGFLKNSPLTSEFTAYGNDKKAAAQWAKRFEELKVDFSLEDISRAAEKARATIYTVVPGRQYLGRPLEERIGLVRASLAETMTQFGPPTAAMRDRIESLWTDEKLKQAAESQTKVQAALAAVATGTGGWTMFLEDPSQADQIYSNIFSDINRRYIVGYYPANKQHDGKRRKVEVTVRDHPDYVVVGRKWYYAPVGDQ
jgi:VWFA-related protein